MLEIVLLFLILLWFLEYTPISTIVISGPILFYYGQQPVSLWNLLFLLLIILSISLSQNPFRQIVSVIALVWILSVLGIIAIGGLTNLLAIAIIVGLLLYIISIKY